MSNSFQRDTFIKKIYKAAKNDSNIIFISADFEDQITVVESFLKKEGVFSTSYIKQEKDFAFKRGKILH